MTWRNTPDQKLRAIWTGIQAITAESDAAGRMETALRISAENQRKSYLRYGDHAIPHTEKEYFISDDLMTEQEAADYCGLDFR